MHAPRINQDICNANPPAPHTNKKVAAFEVRIKLHVQFYGLADEPLDGKFLFRGKPRELLEGQACRSEGDLEVGIGAREWRAHMRLVRGLMGDCRRI